MEKHSSYWKSCAAWGFIPGAGNFFFIEKELGDEVHQSSVYSGVYVFVDHHAHMTSERIL